jgi:small-conductance mechanosensitive channel|tara:strand:+ start:514 stop:780 length:267 start_codon:yes stop_codon:yes gene_type:complete
MEYTKLLIRYKTKEVDVYNKLLLGISKDLTEAKLETEDPIQTIEIDLSKRKKGLNEPEESFIKRIVLNAEKYLEDAGMTYIHYELKIN